MNKEIVVVTAAYGAKTVRQTGGQLALLDMIKRSGAQGVEIRQELLTPDDSLQTIRNKAHALGLFTIYSAPYPLLDKDGNVAQSTTEQALKDAETLGARFLKLPLGNLTRCTTLAGLGKRLRASSVSLLIENDQTTSGGRLDTLNAFFIQVEQEDLPIRMTFDMANWDWLGEDAALAAHTLARHVAYIHVKASQRRDQKICAIALDESGDGWRALLAALPNHVPLGIEFPLMSSDLPALTHYYVTVLKKA